MTPIGKPPTPVRVNVSWDIEAEQWKNIRIIVACGDDGGRIVARDFRELETRARRRGWLLPDVRWWAHWGGIYDHPLAIEHLISRWRLVRGIYQPGAGLWSMDLRNARESWLFRDSARLLPSGLAGIGKAIGLEKLDVDRGHIERLTDAECESYCERDCRIVLKALDVYREVWAALNTAPRDTLAGTSAAWARTHAIPEDAYGWDPAIDRAVSAACYGGRVEVFKRRIERSGYYDINSSYPRAMLDSLPTTLRDSGLGAPPARGGTLAIVRASVRIPDDCMVPPLPYRVESGPLENRLLFPVGEFTGTWTQEELRAAEELCGAQVTPLRYWQYDSAPFLAPFVEFWYRLKRSGNAAEKYIAKLAMNSLYGKTVETDEHQTLTQDFDAAMRAADGGNHVRRYLFRAPDALKGVEHNEGWFDLFAVTSNRDAGFRHAAAGAHITARGRERLLRELVRADRLGSMAYCDTDSIITDVEPLDRGGEVGQFKTESLLSSGEFLSPKVYALNTTWREDGKPCGLEIKAKGLRVLKRADDESHEAHQTRLHETWADIRAGKPIAFETSRGFKTGLASGDIRYTREWVSRAVIGGFDKREFHGNYSRPWNTKVLLNPTQPTPLRPTR